MTWAIETDALTKHFPTQRGWRRLLVRSSSPPAVDQVNLQVAQGELFGLLGPNGAGKTTLIKMLSTLIVPTRGSARINGYSLSQETAIKATTSVVTSDERSFYWRLTGWQNLEFFASLHLQSPTNQRQRIQQALQQVDLLEVANQPFQTYSTGMRQRLSIARALLNAPRLLFLDEPTKGLDPLATAQLHNLILSLVRQQGMTIFLTTHDLDEAQSLCERIAIMHHGHILACGSLDDLRNTLDLGSRYRMRVHGLEAQSCTRLEAMQVQIIPQAPVGLADSPTSSPSLELVFQKNSPSLDDVLRLVQQERGIVETIDLDSPGLETIFADIVSANLKAIYPFPTQPEASRQPAVQTVAPASVSPKSNPAGSHPGLERWRKRLPAVRRVVPAFLKRDFLIEISYRFAFVLQFFGVIFQVAVFYYIAQMLGSAATPYLSEYGGDYFAFVLIGIAFSGYFGVGLSSFSGSLRTAQTTGTLEAMLTTPTRLSVIVLSSSLWDYLFTTFQVFIYLALGAVFLNVNLGKGNYPAALVVLILTVTTFSSLGILAASFIMVLKRGDPITWMFSALNNLLGGVYYPIAVLPGWLQFFSRLLPVTYALRAMRLALLQGAPFAVLLPDLLALAVFSVLLMPASLWAFRYAVRRARIDGSLTHY